MGLFSKEYTAKDFADKVKELSFVANGAGVTLSEEIKIFLDHLVEVCERQEALIKDLQERDLLLNKVIDVFNQFAQEKREETKTEIQKLEASLVWMKKVVKETKDNV